MTSTISMSISIIININRWVSGWFGRQPFMIRALVITIIMLIVILIHTSNANNTADNTTNNTSYKSLPGSATPRWTVCFSWQHAQIMISDAFHAVHQASCLLHHALCCVASLCALCRAGLVYKWWSWNAANCTLIQQPPRPRRQGYPCYHICVCMYMYMYIYIYIYICICTLRYMYTCIYIYIYIHMYIHMYACICIYVCIYIYIYITITIIIMMMMMIIISSSSIMFIIIISRAGAWGQSPAGSLRRGVGAGAPPGQPPYRYVCAHAYVRS